MDKQKLRKDGAFANGEIPHFHREIANVNEIKVDRLKAFLYLLTGVMPIGEIEGIMQKIDTAEMCNDKEIVYSSKYISEYVNNLVFRLVEK